ncbi:MurT ligase domain-containing protein [Mycoplasma sp. P36-A1]|uniref:Mur ligase family protein n=1 Tax=Mycoplasma sp. P36-A1 TaxID=3252900 RepID=UPI003C2C20DD
MSVILGKLAINSSRLIGNRGTDIGGVVALKFNKNIFSKLAANIENIILVTGTNGKSTTTNIIASVLDQLPDSTIDNRKGANMYTGVLTAMIEDYKIFGNNKIKYAVFEVDEGSVPKIMKEINANYLVVTNFFRDQLDRYSEMDMLVDRIDKSLDNKNTQLVLNVDDPFCMRLSNHQYIGYGLSSNIDLFKEGSVSDSRFCPVCGSELTYTHNFYGQLGHYYCSNCSFKRTEPKYEAQEIKDKNLLINHHNYEHNLSGAYNAYNVLAAISILKELNIKDELIEKGLKAYFSNDGRMQKIVIKNNDVYLNLVKNPAGMNMTLQEAMKMDIENIAFILNDHEPDGRDVSWIWDADFEYLLEKNIAKYFVSGTRAQDMALRLKNMGVEPNKIIVDNNFDVLIEVITEKNALVVASYTALNDAKNALMKKEDK